MNIFFYYLLKLIKNIFFTFSSINQNYSLLIQNQKDYVTLDLD